MRLVGAPFLKNALKTVDCYLTNVYINDPGHMTKMAAMPIYGKNPSKIFSETGGLISKKLGMKH